MFHCTWEKERVECLNYIDISLSNVVGKTYAGILVDSKGLIGDEQEYFIRAGMECIDQIFIPKQIGGKAHEKKCRVYAGFMDLEKAH